MAKRTADEVENESIGKFIKDGCGCANGLGGSHCSGLFSLNEIESHRRSMQELETSEKDLVILSLFHFHLNRNSDKLVFQIGGKHVCRKTFLFIFDTSYRVFYTLRCHYLENGLVLRSHGNKNRMPSNTHSLTTNESVKNFIENYAEEHAVILPGRIPGYRNDRIQLIQSSESKKKIFNHYKESCNTANIVSVCYSTFCSLWNNILPYIVVAKPLTDLCWQCQKGNNLLKTISQNDLETGAKERSKILNEQLHLFSDRTPVQRMPASRQD